MTRRMKANWHYPNTKHRAEHDLNDSCTKGTYPCEPAAARRMQANAQYSSDFNPHGKEHDEDARCAVGVPCQPVADPDIAGVRVPDTGTVLVVDGVVQEVVAATKTATDFSDLYTLSVKKPKPAFFEPHKTYRRSASDYQAHRFDCVRIDRDSSGNLIAYGQLYYQTWTTWDTVWFDDTWKEEA